MSRLNLLSWLRKRRRIASDENGNPTVEFVILFPIYIFLFCSAFEVGMYFLRGILLERGLDMTIRTVRIGIYPPSWGDPVRRTDLKGDICGNTPIISNCLQSLNLELINVDSLRTTPNPAFATAAGAIQCTDRGDPTFTPTNSWNPGSRNDVVIIRACWIYDPFFPTFGIAAEAPLQSIKDSRGGVMVFALSAFAVEP